MATPTTLSTSNTPSPRSPSCDGSCPSNPSSVKTDEIAIPIFAQSVPEQATSLKEKKIETHIVENVNKPLKRLAPILILILAIIATIVIGHLLGAGIPLYLGIAFLIIWGAYTLYKSRHVDKPQITPIDSYNEITLTPEEQEKFCKYKIVPEDGSGPFTLYYKENEQWEEIAEFASLNDAIQRKDLLQFHLPEEFAQLLR